MKRLSIVLLAAMSLALLMAVVFPAKTQAQDSDPCDGLPESRLETGGQASVVSSTWPDLPGLFLKPEPVRGGPVLRYLPLGTVVTIDDGPTCSLEGERWWQVTVGELKGWTTETSGQTYLLEAFEGEPQAPLSSTTLPLLYCIRPELGTPAPTPTPDPAGAPVVRAIIGSPDGTLQYSDNGGTPRVVAQFDPPLLSVDLSPDGTAALATNYNGIYWVDLLIGQVVLLADSTTFGLIEGAWPTRAMWLPGGRAATVEIVDSRDNTYNFPVWALPVGGIGEPFRVDIGNVPQNAVRRNPQRDAAIMISANEIIHYPANIADEPPALLEYVPRFDEGDARDLLTPAVSWAPDGEGYYTYIPVSDSAPPDDEVGGHLWFVPLEGEKEDLGELPNIGAADYVIPSPDGKSILVGSGSSWRIQSPETGEPLLILPPVQFLFDWTPDSKGVVYTTTEGRISYLGIDGTTTSALVPAAADNLFSINWLADGTTLFVARGADDQFSFSIQRPGQDALFIGLVNTIYAYDTGVFPTAPGLATPPQACE
jgi:hypothetical protein